MNKIVRPNSSEISGKLLTVDQLLRSGSGSLTYRMLEARMAFDGAAIATAAVVDQAQAEQQAVPTADAPTADHAVDTTDADTNASDGLAALAENLMLSTDAAPAPASNTVIFIDGSVNDVGSLLAGIGGNAEIHILDSTSGGFAQIASYLSGRNDVDSIQIISHGQRGTLFLGDDIVTSTSLGAHASDLQIIADALSDDGDILLFGCNVAEGADGKAFIDQLATLTHADVAGSTDATGSELYGADWELEYEVGLVTDRAAWTDRVSDDFTEFLNVTVSNGNGQYLIAVDLNIYSVDPATGKAVLVTAVPSTVGTVAIGTAINSLAVDQANGLIYYCSNTQLNTNVALLAYDFINNQHIVIDNSLTDNGAGASITVLARGVSSGAATFNNGTLYLGIENNAGTVSGTGAAATGTLSTIYRVTFTAAGRSIGAISQFSAPRANDWGDMSFDAVNNVLLSFTGASGLTRYNAATGALINTVTIPANLTQGGSDINGNTYIVGQNPATSGPINFQQINTTTGAGIGSIVTVTTDGTNGLPGLLTDAAGWTPQTGVVGDTIFYDTNANGIQDATDVGAANVTVQLIRDLNNNGVVDGSDAVIATDTTSATGGYRFSGVLPGHYIVRVTDTNGVLTGRTYTTAGGALRSDADLVSDGTTRAIGLQVLGVDFGLSNAAPAAVNDTFTTIHDTAVTFNPRTNDTDANAGDAALLTITQIAGIAVIPGGPGVAVTGGTAALNAAGNIVFTPTANFAGATTFTYQVSDGKGGFATATINGTVTNATPVVDLDASGAGQGFTTTYTENGPAVSIADIDAVITDTDDANMDSAIVALTNAQTGDRLVVNGSTVSTGILTGNITYTINAAATSVTLSGSATRADYANAIRAIQFESTSENPSTTPRTITVVANDGIIASNTATATINVDLAPDPVNDTVSGNEDSAISGNVLTNDTDTGNGPGTPPLAIVTGPTSGTLTSFNTTTGAFVYTPNANFNGTDTFVYRYTDADGDSKTATVTLTVNPMNDAPANTVGGPRSTTEDVALAITGVTVTDIDSASAILTTTLTLPAGTGTLSVNTLGAATITGNASNTVVINGTAAQINTALNGLIYTPVLDYNTGTPAAPFNLRVETSDGLLADIDNVAITVTPQADIAPDNATTTEENPVTINVLGNDTFENSGRLITEINGTSIAVGGTVAVANGTVTLNASGTLTFAPALNYNGTTTFNYTVLSGGVTEQALVTVDVTPINDLPVNTVPGPQSTNEDAFLNISGVSVADIEGGTLTTRVTLPVGTGTLSIATGSGATVTGDGTRDIVLSGNAAQINAALAGLRYTPLADYNTGTPALPFNLTVQTTDANGAVDTDLIAITVVPQRDTADDTITTNEDTAASFNVLTGTNGATADNFESATPQVTGVTQGTNGTVSFSPTGQITYTPNANFNGTDTFQYTVTSGGVTETATVNITITAVADRPTQTVPPTHSTLEDTAVIFSATNGNQIVIADIDSNVTTSLSIANGLLTLGSTAGVTVTGNGTGAITVSGTPAAVTAALNGLRFAPTADWNGTTALNVSTTDSATAPVANAITINVTADPDINPNSVTTNEDTPVNVNVLANDTFEGTPVITHINGTPIAVGGSVTIPNGSVRLNADATLTFTPNANYNGSSSFNYTVLSGGVTEQANVAYTVVGTPDAPVNTVPGPQSVAEDTPLPITGVTVADVDGDTLTTTLTATNGTLSVRLGGGATITGNNSGTVTLVGTAAQINNALLDLTFANTRDYNGPASLEVRTSDGALVDTDTIAITVTPLADIINDTATTDENVSVTIDVLANDSFENPARAITHINGTAIAPGGTISVANGTVRLELSGRLTFTPTPSYNGPASFDYTVTSGGVIETATVNITVNPINDAPMNTVPGPQTVGEDASTPITGISIADIDGGNQTATLTVANGRLSVTPGGAASISGNNSGTVVISGTIADVNVVLASLQYRGNADYNGPDTLSVSTTDGISTDLDTVAITVTPEIDIAADSALVDEDQSVTINVIANDTFEDPTRAITAVNGVAISVGGSVLVLNGTVTLTPLGQLTFTPSPNYNGPASFTYTVNSSGITETATVSITVRPINDAPVNTVPGAQTTPEDTQLTISGLSVTNVDGDTLTTQLSVPPGRGTLTVITTGAATIAGNGTATVTITGTAAQITTAINAVRYTPIADYNTGAPATPFNLTIVTTDSQSTSDTDTIAITVVPNDDATDDVVTINEDTAPQFNVLTGTGGATADTFESPLAQVTAVTQGSNGSVTFLADGRITYTPNPNYNGTDTFSYTVTSGGVIETATVTVTVNPTADPPVQTVPGPQSTLEDDTLTFSSANNNLVSIADPDGGSVTTILTVTSGTLQIGGNTSGVSLSGNNTSTVTLIGTPSAINAAIASFTFAPTADYNGLANLQISTNDGSTTATSTVAITVTPVADIVNNTTSTPEDTAVTINVLTNDNFENAGAIINRVTNGANGTVTIGVGGNVTYTPNLNFNGSDSFSYTVRSGGVEETATVNVTVTPVADLVDLNVPGAQNTNEDLNLVFSTVNNNAITVSDDDGSTLTVTLSTGNGTLFTILRGSVTATGIGSGLVTLRGTAADLNLTLNGASFRPNADYNGPASIAVNVTDGVSSSSGAIGVTVRPVADILPDAVTTSEDTPISFNVITGTNGATADTFESPGRIVTSVTQGASGTVSFAADGSIIYTPNTNFSGTDTFDYVVTSGGVTETARVTVTVNAVNDAPQTTGLADRMNIDGQAVSVNVAGSFSDLDGDTLTYTATGLPPGLSINATTGLISGTIDNSASLIDPFSVTVTGNDGRGGLVSATFTWTVTNPAPTANNDTASVAEDQTRNIVVLANDTDPDGDTLVVTSATAGNGTVVIRTNGTIDYTPAPNFNGTDTIVYRISDGEGGISTATVTVTVTPVNDAPTTTGLPNLIDSDGQSVSIDITSAFSDIDGDTLTYSVNSVPPGLTFDPNTGVFSGTLTPSASQTGPYPITVTANDGNGGAVATSFTWFVVNLPPTADDDAVTTAEDTPVVVSVLTNDSDPDNDPLIISRIDGQAIVVNGPAITVADGTVALSLDGFGNQVLVFTPTLNFNGVTSLVYSASDGNGGEDTATLTITVDPRNDAPTSTAISNLTNADSETVSVPLAPFFSDIDTINGDVLTFSAIGLPPGLSINSATGVISGTLTSSASQAGPYIVTVLATDSQLLTTQQSFTWRVTNPAPTARNDFNTALEGQPLNVTAFNGVLINDTDPDGDALTVQAINSNPALVGLPVAGSAGGLFTIFADGSYTFTQNGNFEDLQVSQTRVTTINYRVSDGNGGFSVATLSITVSGQNDAPVATLLPNQTGVDNLPFSLNTSTAFSDVEADTLRYTATGLPAGLTINPATGVITGTIDNSASQGGVGGTYTVSVTADDRNGGTAVSTFTLAVTNPAPNANDDVRSVTEDVVETGNVLSNDTDPDGDTLTVTSFTVPGLGTFTPGQSATIPGIGTISIASNGAYTFTPATNFIGTVPVIAYAISDGEGGVDIATLTLDPIIRINDAPTSTPLAPQSSADRDAVSVSVFGNFTDIDGDALSFSAIGLPSGLSINPTTGIISGTISNAASATAPYTVMVTARDPGGLTTSRSFTWAVSNPAPVATALPATTGVDATPVSIPVAFAFSDPDADAIRFSASGLPAGLSINPTTGIITGTLASGASRGGPGLDGVYTIAVTATDAQGALVIQTFTYTVSNPAPLAVNDIVSGREDVPISGSVASNDRDPDGDSVSFAVVTPPTFGTVVLNANGTFSYTPNANYHGADSFTYRIIDSAGASATATVALTITPVNDAPIAGPSSLTTVEETPFSGTLPPATDIDGDTVTYGPGSPPLHGTVVINPDGTYTYTPAPNYSGPDSFTYTVSDGNGGQTRYPVTVIVTPTQDPPVISVVTPPTSRDSDVVRFDLSRFVRDPDGDRLTFTATGLPPGLSINPATGVITGTLPPNASQTGPYAVSFSVDDGNGNVISSTFMWTVTNPPPIANNDSAITKPDTPISLAPLTNDRDPDGDPLIVTGATAGNGTVEIGPDGSIRYTPAAGFKGTDSIQYIISDGNGGFATATITIIVGGIDERPRDVVFEITGPGGIADTPFPSTQRTFDTITAEGAVVDAVFTIHELHSVANALTENGIVLAAANALRPLGGIASIGSNGVVVDTIRYERARELLEAAGFDRPSNDYKLMSLPGFSIRRDIPGNLGGLSTREQIIVESLVRQRTLILQISNTIVDGTKKILGYTISQIDGSPLPNWLDRPGPDLLIGRRAADFDVLELRIEAVYSDGTKIVQDVRIDTATGEIQPIKPQQDGQQIAPPMFKDQFPNSPALTPNEIDSLGRLLKAG